MVDLAGKFGIKAMMDTSGVEQGAKKISRLLTDTGRKMKETNTFFDRSVGLLKSMSKAAVLFGGGIIGALTGAIASSPHFKAFLAGLKGPWIKLTQYLGERFKPLLDVLGVKFKQFVEVLTGNKSIRDFFDKWVKKISEFVGNISKEDMKNFMTWVTDTVDTALDFTLSIAGNLWDTLVGSSEEKGLLKQLWDMGGSITKTLKLDLQSPGTIDKVTKALIAVGAWKMGGPVLGIPVTSALLATEVSGFLGGAGVGGEKRTEDVGLLKDIGRATWNYGVSVMGLDPEKYAFLNYGTIPGEDNYKGDGRYSGAFVPAANNNSFSTDSTLRIIIANTESAGEEGLGTVMTLGEDMTIVVDGMK